MKTKLPVFATIFTILGIAVLGWLGNWQLQRLEWKTAILNKLEREYAKDAPNTFIALGNLDTEFDYRRGTLKGAYLYNGQVRVGPRRYGNLPGYHVLTPLRLSDGSHILVNRGWVPQSWREEKENTGEIVPVTGLIRRPGDRNAYTPANEPGKDEWYSTAPDEIAAAKQLENMRAHVLYLESDDLSGTYPLALESRPELRNDHLMYAIFWFTMAAVLAVIYMLRFFRKPGA